MSEICKSLMIFTVTWLTITCISWFKLWKLVQKLLKCYIRSIALYDAEVWTLRKVYHKYVESFEI
jgi:hypothetical protein